MRPLPLRLPHCLATLAAPVLCAVTDLNETHALLTESCRNVLLDIGAAIERQREQLAGQQ